MTIKKNLKRIHEETLVLIQVKKKNVCLTPTRRQASA